MSDPSTTSSSFPSTTTSPTASTPTDTPGPLSGQPLSYTIIPLGILAIAAAVTLIICIRRKRAGRPFNWTGISDADIERANRNTATRRPVGRGGRQWAVWRTDDGLGLDENGDAPPAYEPKARPGQTLESTPVRGDTTAAVHGSYELDDMRRPDGTTVGSSSSPSPPGSPGPVVTAPAQAHTQQEAPPPEYDSVTAGSTPPPPSTPHPGTVAAPPASPLITTPPPAVSFTGRRG
ncbi:hypothetical protein B0T11DRAFT_98124 [Plectosphaerella cucumerina]|uniref:Uncharacterized protein n=1 Tax=Plectosphaerella cucumerina TaxID=40658 RepID=A0A8K0TBH9_9PEZI|nr:hypothetical protein B0T11DRAFT_98124 [Plectosphaerella cucumerina]